MLVITDEEIKKHVSMKQCLAAVEEAAKIYRTGNNKQPIRTAMNIDKQNGTMLYMPSYSEEVGYTAVKIVSVFPENRNRGMKSLQSKILLTDAETGAHVALMDASWLTVMRTGAISGVAAKYLAREDTRTCLVIGCGEQARGQIGAALEVRELETVYLYNPTRSKAESLKAYILDELAFNGKVEVVEDPDEKAGDVDMIITATNSVTPVFDGNLIKPGTHISGIGSFKPSMQEVDGNVLKKANKIMCDTFEGCMEEAGDFLIPMEKGEFSEETIEGELADLVLGAVPGREDNDEITFFKSVGFAMADLVTAVEIYRVMKKQ